jgi:TonB family protein
MILAGILLVGLSLGLAQSPKAQPQQQPPCAQVMADAVTDSAASEICAGDDAARLAAAAPKDSSARTRQLEAAATHYRRAATVASKPTTKLLALNVLAGAYDAQHLNDPRQMESVLREVIVLTPEDLAPVFRLAKVQEDEGLLDSAEATLLDARHRQPDAVEPYQMLTQFFARRVTALHKQEVQNQPQQAASSPGEPDANGVYRVGGSITQPARDDVPHFPPEAQAAGVKGVVVAEVVIDMSGNVTDARVVQSIPLLDDEALRVVRNWHFAPTMLNGQPVPVRMNLYVNFSLPATPAPPAPPR